MSADSRMGCWVMTVVVVSVLHGRRTTDVRRILGDAQWGSTGGRLRQHPPSGPTFQGWHLRLPASRRCE